MLTDQEKEITASDCINFMMHLKTLSTTSFEGPIVRIQKTNHLQVDLSHYDFHSLLPESLQLKLDKPLEPYYCSLVFGKV